MALKDPVQARRNIISGWRRRKKLCLLCGKDIHDGKCIEDYTKVDMRVIEVKPKTPANEEKRKATIRSYRKKKLLCLRCGQNVHGGDCEVTYERTDMRPVKIKDIDPRVVVTPKVNIFKPDIESSTIGLSGGAKPSYNREFVLLDVRSNNDYDTHLSFVHIRYIARKFKDCIICLIGDMSGIYTYADFLNVKKIFNVIRLGDIDDQTIVNHIHNCKYFISYKSEYTKYANSIKSKCISLDDDKDVQDILVRIPK
jgi:hypothetical protein